MNYEELEFYMSDGWGWKHEPWPRPTNEKGISQITPAAIRRNRMLPMFSRTRGDVGLIE